MKDKVVLVTGAAKRIGAVIAKTLHQQGAKIVIHYHHSQRDAERICNELNEEGKDTAKLVFGDVTNVQDCQRIIQEAIQYWGKLDALINNASSFYSTPVGDIDETVWNDLMGSNLKGPLFLSQAAAHYLLKAGGSIVNIVDIHANRPLKNYPVYCCAKAGLVMLTKSLARELAPEVKVNAVAPGAILWPNEQNSLSDQAKKHIIDRTLLKRLGEPQDIANAVLFFLTQNYITGQVLAVDGGRSIKD